MVALYLDPVANLWPGSLSLSLGIVLQIADAAFPGCWCWADILQVRLKPLKYFSVGLGRRLAECSEQPWHDGPGRGVTINSLSLIE